MRLQLALSPNTRTVSFDHLPALTGAVHKWLGENHVHDKTSLYSFGWLRGGKVSRGSLGFPGGATWTISFLSDELGEQLRQGIRVDPHAISGMRVYEIREQLTPHFGEQERFEVDGAVLTRKVREEGGKDHLTFQDPESAESLTRTLRWKLGLAGFEGEHLSARTSFDQGYEKARTKLVKIKGISYRTNECPIIVEGTPEAVQAAWLFGAGELTGMGLGALK